jgi:Skp family chaperone for outer membrane proteins
MKKKEPKEALDKPLRKMSRAELLDIILEQSRQIDRLQRKLDAANAKLDERQIAIDNSGNIAEAALKLNGVFEAAQKAAEEYLANVQRSVKGEND